MGKKSKKKLIDRILKIQEKEEKKLKKQVSIFYEDGKLVSIKSSSNDDPFLGIFSTLKTDNVPKAFTEEKMSVKCLQIREYVDAGIPNNIRLDFQEMVARFDNFDYELETALIRVMAMNGKKPIYIQLTKGDKLQSHILIGGDDAYAFLLTKDKDGRDTVIRLSEINLLAFHEKPKPNQDSCLVSIYSWLQAVVFAGIIRDSQSVVKQLLSSDQTRRKYVDLMPNKLKKKKHTDDPSSTIKIKE